jgi:DNA-binding transcriptional LysR family regulator
LGEIAALDSAELRVFEAVARTGAMKRTADDLHTVQSNVTARVKALEDEMGCAPIGPVW